MSPPGLQRPNARGDNLRRRGKIRVACVQGNNRPPGGFQRQDAVGRRHSGRLHNLLELTIQSHLEMKDTTKIQNY
jgi:hypothetical protein